MIDGGAKLHINFLIYSSKSRVLNRIYVSGKKLHLRASSSKLYSRNIPYRRYSKFSQKMNQKLSLFFSLESSFNLRSFDMFIHPNFT